MKKRRSLWNVSVRRLSPISKRSYIGFRTNLRRSSDPIYNIKFRALDEIKDLLPELSIITIPIRGRRNSIKSLKEICSIGLFTKGERRYVSNRQKKNLM